MTDTEKEKMIKTVEDQMSTLRLEWNKFGAMKMIPLESIDLSNLDFMYRIDHEVGALVLKLRALIAGRKSNEVIRFPVDWKQAVKERFAPQWYRRWRPVRYACYQAGEFFTGIKREAPSFYSWNHTIEK